MAAAPASTAGATTRPAPGQIKVQSLSSGGRAWFDGPQLGSGKPPFAAARVAFGGNTDANNPQADLAAGQSETAVAAAGSTVVAAWNDATGFLVSPSTDRRASLTGVGLSTDGGRTFRDLTGLRNSNSPNQQWFGDPTIAAIDAHHFAIGSLFLPSNLFDCSTGPARFQIAVEILTVSPTGAASFGLPVVAADGGDLCTILNGDPADDDPSLAFLDKEWLSYDGVSRRLGISYTRFFFGYAGQSGAGQVELCEPGCQATHGRSHAPPGRRPSPFGRRNLTRSTPVPTSRWHQAVTRTSPGSATSTRTCSTATRTSSSMLLASERVTARPSSAVQACRES